MSHLIKDHKKIKKTLKYIFYFLLLFTIGLTTINYDGSKFTIFVYALLINLILLNGFKKNSYFFEFFFGILLWLGFWLKLIFIVNYYDYSFFEGAGNTFENISLKEKLIQIDKALIISIFAFSSYIFAFLIKDFFYKKNNSNKNKITFNGNKFFSKIQNFIIILFLVVVFYTSFFNLDNLIYQRGLKSQSEFNFVINGIVKWVLLFGFSSIVSFFIFINLNSKKKIYQFSFVSVLETFVSSISYLSRGMIFNSLSIFYGIYKSNKIYKLKLNLKFFLIYFFLIFIFFFISVSSINYLRHNFFYYNLVEKTSDNDEKKNIFDVKNQNQLAVEKKYDTLGKAINEFYFLAINRWVGIDAVLSTTSRKGKNWDLFINSFKEKYDTSQLPYYERVIQKRNTKINQNQSNYGITTPGIVSFLFYSGSKVFLIFSLFTLTSFMLLFEKFILNKTSNLIFCALIMQQVAYRLAHFGYMPLNSYMFFGTIIITVLIHLILVYLYKNIDL